MSFPNSDWQHTPIHCPDCKVARPGAKDGTCGCGAALVEPPRWNPVAGKPNIYVHDDNGCEAEIYRVECEDCGSHALVYYSACGCDDHKPGEAGHDYATPETCAGCGRRMTRLEVPEDGSWPPIATERVTGDTT